MARFRTASAVLMVLGGLVHVVGTPFVFDELSSMALWFSSGGLMMVFLGFLNLTASGAGRGVPLLRFLTALANLMASLLMVLLWVSTRAAQPAFMLALILLAVASGLGRPARRPAARPPGPAPSKDPGADQST